LIVGVGANNRSTGRPVNIFVFVVRQVDVARVGYIKVKLKLFVIGVDTVIIDANW